MKPLDDAFDRMNVTYLRYQDDVIVFCQTKRQLKRCKERLFAVLKERKLRLSTKKTRIGSIDKGFHFLGINYLEPQSPDRASCQKVHDDSATSLPAVLNSTPMSAGGAAVLITGQLELMQQRIVPHARTLRNAREQVKQMVASGVSLHRVMSYLSQWVNWWTQTAQCWTKHELLTWFLDACWDATARNVAKALLAAHSCVASNSSISVHFSAENQVLIHKTAP